ncbi:MAG: transketolase C-terminal domain-containing protein, partial [Chloroflexota bacterium]|nr:transketolase C-terminal domain-containing protein [Chloroflexota bacterium]
ISTLSDSLMEDIRTRGGPRALILNTCRFGPHSKGDDSRDPERLAILQRDRDPVAIHAPRLDAETRAVIKSEINAEVETAFEQATNDPMPQSTNPQSTIPHSTNPQSTNSHSTNNQFTIPHSTIPHSTVLQSLNAALHQALSTDERTLVMGEDILDPYGGAFKVTKGLSDAFPQRVLTTPISEAGIVGVAAGMALRGLRPVVEIMFGDFITLIADQLINQIAKFRWMYNDQVRVPLVIRTPMGGRRGYGPTHSQSLEKLYLGVPGLRVLAPSALGNPGELLAQAIAADDPVLFIENKLLYLTPLQDADSLSEFNLTSFTSPNGCGDGYTLTVRGAPPPELTIAAYGYMAELARQAVRTLAYQHEIFAELVLPTQLAPFDIEPILDSTRRTRRLLVAEEGTFTLGWGAEVVARAAESMGSNLRAVQRVAALDTPIPASVQLENVVLPGVNDIVAAARSMFK